MAKLTDHLELGRQRANCRRWLERVEKCVVADEAGDALMNARSLRAHAVALEKELERLYEEHKRDRS